MDEREQSFRDLQILLPPISKKTEFVIGEPISEESFFDREEEIGQALKLLEDKNRVLINCPRRTGGTSLSHILAKRQGPNYESMQFAGESLRTKFSQKLAKIPAFIQAERKDSSGIVFILDDLEALDSKQLQQILEVVEQARTPQDKVIGTYKDNLVGESQEILEDFFGKEKVSLNLVDDQVIKKFFEARAPWFGQLPEPVQEWMIKESGGFFIVAQIIGYAIRGALVGQRLGKKKTKKYISFAELEDKTYEKLQGWLNLFSYEIQGRPAAQRTVRATLANQRQELSDWEKNSLPRPSATMFYRWAEEKMGG